MTEIFNRSSSGERDDQGCAGAVERSELRAPFQFFERAPDAPPPPVSAEQTSSVRTRAIRDLSSSDAYQAALDRDTLQDYEAFLPPIPVTRWPGVFAPFRGPARGSDLAAQPHDRHARGLLVLPAPLSERHACRRCTTSAGLFRGCAGAATAI